MPEKQAAAADPDAGMIREGSSEPGGPSVRFDAKKRANYHLDMHGARVYHGTPEGFQFNDTGELQAVPVKEG